MVWMRLLPTPMREKLFLAAKSASGWVGNYPADSFQAELNFNSFSHIELPAIFNLDDC